MLDLRDKSVWITGASSGIGSALAEVFARHGARLLLSARRVERLRDLARRTGPRVQVLPLDLDDLDDLPGKSQLALSMLGGVDVMVHNAGVGQRSLASETSFAVDRRMMTTNYLGPIAITKALLPSMLQRRSGRFLVVSSVLGVMAAQRRSAYCASKHALHGFFDSLRAEVASHGIGVHLVCPGRVLTEFSEAALEGDGRRHGVIDPSSQKGLPPQVCAEQAVAALIRGRAETYVARWESAAVYLHRYAPALMRAVLARMA